MKKNILHIGFALFLIASPFLCLAQSSFVGIQGKKFYLNGNEFYPVGVNYLVDVVDDGNGGFYVAPNNGYGAGIDYESNDAAGNLQEIKDDFLRMKSMGINSIRLVGLCPTKNPNGDGFIFTEIPNVHPIWLGDQSRTQVTISPPYSGNTTINPICAAYFSMINDVLSAAYDPANNLDLKVTLLAGGGSGVTPNQRSNYQYNPGVTTSSGRVDYANYLSALAANFSANASLFAYDLFNEPGGSSSAGPNDGGTANVPNKEDVCNLVNLWYNAIKTYAPNQFVTLGGFGSYDIVKWDPAVMNLDFYSLHTYPSIADPTSPAAITLGINRVLSEMYWMTNNVNIPWIIGETGFSANVSGLPAAVLDSNGIPILLTGVDGNYTDQENFASSTLSAAGSFGAAGYTWWQYQDVYWCNGCREDNFALIDHADNFKQPTVSAFQNFNPSIISTLPSQPPANYYNQYNYPYGPVIGFVIDNTGQPVKDALVIGVDAGFNNPVRTFTKTDGSFDLYSSINPISSQPNVIRFLNAYATSANAAPFFITISNQLPFGPYYFTLNFAGNYNLNESNQTFTSSNGVQTFVAQNNITSNNFLVDGNGSSGGNVTFKAGGEISLREFTVKRGGDFHALYGLPQSNCSDVAYMRTASNSSSSGNSSITNTSGTESFLLLQPDNIAAGATLSAYESPNPTNDGKIGIYLSDATKFSEITITDMLGRVVQHIMNPGIETKIDLAENPRGIYFVTITGESNVFVKKIIYQ